MTDMQNFSKIKNEAIKELHEMSRKATEKQPFATKISRENNKNSSNNFGLSLSNDDLLILGLILILHQDCYDKWLFLALLYILL